MGSASTEKIAGRYDRWSAFYDLADRFGPLARRERGWRRRVVGKMREERGWVLDAACGTGMMARLFAEGTFQGRLLALDASNKMVRKAKVKVEEGGLQAHVVLGDVTRLPLSTGSLGGIICTFSLTTIGYPEEAITEFGRVLPEGSRLVVLDSQKPRHRAARLLHALLVPISRAFGRTHIDRDLRGLLDRASFAMEECEDFLGGMVGIYVLRRKKRRALEDNSARLENVQLICGGREIYL